MKEADRALFLKIALLQVNPIVGDLAGNSRLIAEALARAAGTGAQLAVTPELALVGYLPRDLLLSKGYIVHGIKRRASSLNTERIDYLYRDRHDAGVRLFLDEADRSEPLHALVNELLLSPMGRREWPLRFYSPERLFSVEARRCFVPPDIQTL